MTIHELSERGLTYCACNRQRYHCVLNLDFSVAVTQNLLPVATVSQAWPQVGLGFKLALVGARLQPYF